MPIASFSDYTSPSLYCRLHSNLFNLIHILYPVRVLVETSMGFDPLLLKPVSRRLSLLLSLTIRSPRYRPFHAIITAPSVPEAEDLYLGT